MSFKNHSPKIFIGYLLLFFYLFFGWASFIHGEQLSSPIFKVIDSTVGNGGFSSSTNFQLFGDVSQIANGQNTSSSYGGKSGFLYYPDYLTSAITATPGDSQIALSWSNTTGYLGWTSSGYNLGLATVSGGPYTYTSLGDVTSATVADLTNGVTYYFVVVTKNIFGNAVATSSESSVTPSSLTVPDVVSSGNGSSGMIATINTPKVIFNDKYFLVLPISDSASGNHRYEVKEGLFGKNETVKSPSYLLKDQTRHSIITVKEIDKDGKETVTTIIPNQIKILYVAGSILGLLLVILIFLWLKTRFLGI